MKSSVDKETVQALCQEVGQFMLEQSLKFEKKDIKIKSNQSLVSYVDKQSERMLIDGLQRVLPEAGFLVEEGSVEHNKSKQQVWIIDPLDGTTNYLHHLPWYCISIALQCDGELTHGFIYHVSTGDFFSARKGEGAYLNGKPIKLNQHHEFSECLFATGFPHGMDRDLGFYFDLLQSFTLNSRGIRRLGSAALDLAYVAAGRFSGFYEIGLQAWDIAAGIILVQEAGGIVSGIEGKDDALETGNIIASNPVLHPKMKDIIDKHWHRA